jgi:hypothetical protein
MDKDDYIYKKNGKKFLFKKDVILLAGKFKVRYKIYEKINFLFFSFWYGYYNESLLISKKSILEAKEFIDKAYSLGLV